MLLNENHRKKFVIGYCAIFYMLMLLKLWNGFLLFQLQPAIFNTRSDLLTWIVMTTGIHQWLLNNPTGWIIFDIAFYLMPLLHLIAYFKSLKLASVVAIVMLVVNYWYVQCYTLYPANSIESFTPWLLFPFLFMAVSLRNFYFVLHALRFFFLFFFTSAALWKVVQGGIFNLDQMSGILLYQHKEYLASSPGFWYSDLTYWLVGHPLFSYCLYLFAALLELSYATGFFTKKYDHFLIIATAIFLITDQFFMRIPYWEITPFLLTFIYSKYAKPTSR